MSQSPLQRSVAACLAVVLTLALMGGLDRLAQPGAQAGEQPAQMAQKSATSA